VFVVSRTTKFNESAVDKPPNLAIALATIIQNSLPKSFKPLVTIELWMPL
jgi:hypothetical protein